MIPFPKTDEEMLSQLLNLFVPALNDWENFNHSKPRTYKLAIAPAHLSLAVPSYCSDEDRVDFAMSYDTEENHFQFETELIVRFRHRSQFGKMVEFNEEPVLFKTDNLCVLYRPENTVGNSYWYYDDIPTKLEEWWNKVMIAVTKAQLSS